MFEKLTVSNFRIHEFYSFEFDPRVTTITGTNDKGKTSLLKALFWLCFNPRLVDKPPNTFIRHGSRQAFACLALDGGHEIVRLKSPKENIYTLDGKRYQAVGDKKAFVVPEDIKRFVNLGPVNFQHQFDGPFWFGDSAAKVSREVNKIVDLQIIDNTMQALATKQRKAKYEVDSTQARLDTAKATVKALDWVVEADRWLGRLEEADTRIFAKREKLRRLNDLVQKCVGLRQAKEDAACATTRAVSVVLAGDALAQKHQKHEKLVELLSSIASLRAREAIPDVTSLETSVSTLTERYRQRERLEDSLKTIGNLRDKLCRLRRNIGHAEDKLKSTKTCPLCDRPFTTSF